MKPKTLASLNHTSHVQELNKSLERLKRSVVFVGIASGSKTDAREDGGPPNHLLGFVHEHGSPAANIPPRPFLVPGVKSGKEKVTKHLEAAMRAALNDDDRERQKFCVHGIIGARQTGASNEHEHQTQFS